MKAFGPEKRPRGLRYRTGTVRRVMSRTRTAAQLIGPLAPGDRVTGVTAGQFSAIDILEHMWLELGVSAVSVATWTVGVWDARRCAEALAAGRLSSLRFILDRASFQNSPGYAGPLIEWLGTEAIRCASMHAKVCVAVGERGSAVLRSSMNVNKNLRAEQFDIDVCPEVSGFYLDWFDALWSAAGRNLSDGQMMRAVYDRWRVDPVIDEPQPIDSRDRGAGGPRQPRLSDVSFSLDDLRGLID